MKLATVVAAGLIGIALTGCAEDVGTKQTIGTVLGAAGGGLLGSQFGHGSGKLVATAAGVFVGGLLGSEIGRSLDKADRQAADGAQVVSSS